ncbi:ABC transporter permease subunit (plasmid) [Paenibacillus rhizovicinus]|uniref:ABC transporter permease subunit n=1 Tax=Paenibacillus rhizovicinus TaxID=2704463 RepID=A0A6C0PC82_9BACL|nr:ABC transporter permease subunit [Paenibacillus rhizovicinus]QHW35413.1 ABC transporter permease subunit [Paenibacillus rhizovicinus]
MNAWHIAVREIRIGFRNPWAYSFLGLFSVFSLSLLLIQAQNDVEGFSSITGTLLNLMLYLLPLMALLLGTFTLTSEKEEGSWQLLSSYPLSTFAFLSGKYIGMAIVMLTIVAFGFGLTGVVGALVGIRFGAFGLFIAFSSGLVLLFLAVALWLGTIASNRWQALIYGVSVWFFSVIGWPTLLIAVLGFVPYGFIKPILLALTALNPAEFVRLFVIVRLGGGSALGPEYYDWIVWVRGPYGLLLFSLLFVGFIGAAAGVSYVVWERRRIRG